MTDFTLHIDPRHNIRDLELMGLFKKYPQLVGPVVLREINRALARVMLYDPADDFVDPICRQDAMVQRRNHNHMED